MESHRVIIAGSRGITLTPSAIHDIMWQAGYHYDREHAEKHNLNHMRAVVSGNARGIDRSGEDFAQFYGVPYEIFAANWERYGRAAGPIRNKQMADIADTLILIWDGKSTGSGSMKSIMLGLGKPVYEVVFKGWS